jgi:hypothetical protein
LTDKTNRKPVQKDQQLQSERRRVATVVHDQRGNASVEWQDAPADYERPVLEILDDAPYGPSREHGFDPYASTPRRASGPDPYASDPGRQRRVGPPARAPLPESGNAAPPGRNAAPPSRDAAHNSGRPTQPGSDVSRRPRTDLRKLSEWIKLMRELEARKQSGAGDAEGGGEDRGDGNGAA